MLWRRIDAAAQQRAAAVSPQQGILESLTAGRRAGPFHSPPSQELILSTHTHDTTTSDRSVRRQTLTRERRACQPLARSLLVKLGAVADSVDAHRVAGA